MRRRDVLRAGVLVPVGVTAGCADAAELFFGADVDITPEVAEEKMFDMVNEERREAGMAPFDWHDGAAEAARAHAQDMAENDYYDHTAPDGTTQQERYAFCSGGENIDKTYLGRYVTDPDGGEAVMLETDEELAEHFVRSWMNSPPHRDRGILGPATSAGPGITVSNDEQDAYAVLGLCLR